MAYLLNFAGKTTGEKKVNAQLCYRSSWPTKGAAARLALLGPERTGRGLDHSSFEEDFSLGNGGWCTSLTAVRRV